MDLAGGIPGGPANDVVFFEAHGQKLTHGVEHVLHAGIHASDVQIGRNGIGQEALLNSGNCDAPSEAAAAVPDVEDDASFAALDHASVHVSGCIQFVAKARIAVRVDVARA